MLGTRASIAVVLALAVIAMGGCSTNGSAPGQSSAGGRNGPFQTTAGSATSPGPLSATSSPPSPAATETRPQPTRGSPPTPSNSAASGSCPSPSGLPITVAPGAGRTVALTFDDGASDDMAAVADALRASGVRVATFFDTGGNDAKATNVVQGVAAMGYLVENHSWDHQYPTAVKGGWSITYLRDQISRTAAQAARVTGTPQCFFRPPGGFTTNVQAASAAEGMSAVLWSVDTLDWKSPDHLDPSFQQQIVARATTLTPDVADHPIVLMHAGKASHEPERQVHAFRGNTIAALPAIVSWYRTHGYTFVDLFGHT